MDTNHKFFSMSTDSPKLPKSVETSVRVSGEVPSDIHGLRKADDERVFTPKYEGPTKDYPWGKEMGSMFD